MVMQLPSIRREWQFPIDIIPIPITAERLAHVGTQDCDAFVLCQYITEDEGGLLGPNMPLERLAEYQRQFVASQATT